MVATIRLEQTVEGQGEGSLRISKDMSNGALVHIADVFSSILIVVYILIVIVETDYPNHSTLYYYLDLVFLLVFVTELLLRLAADGVRRFFLLDWDQLEPPVEPPSDPCLEAPLRSEVNNFE